MNTQEEIVQLRKELAQAQKLLLKSRRRTAITFGSLSIIVLLSFVYAYVRQVAEERSASLAIEQRTLAMRAESMAVASQEEARKQQALAVAQRTAAAEMVKGLTEELAKCRGARKK